MMRVMTLQFWLTAFGIIVLSLVNNWLVQLIYYLRTKKDHLGQRTLLNYYTGVIGDGVIAPIINVLVYFVMAAVQFTPSASQLILAIIGAILIDISIHFLQGKLGLVNWSMRVPYKWNFAGKWHMISLPIQVTYLLLFSFVLWSNTREVFLNPATTLAVNGVVILSIIFVRLAMRDHWWI